MDAKTTKRLLDVLVEAASSDKDKEEVASILIAIEDILATSYLTEKCDCCGEFLFRDDVETDDRYGFVCGSCARSTAIREETRLECLSWLRSEGNSI